GNRGMIKLIANPIAGRGRGREALPAAEEALRRQGLQFSTEVTSRPLEAMEIARRAAEEGCELVVALGGDGTSHEVANGLLSSGNSEVALGMIPIGNGNDFVESLDLPVTDLAAAVHRLRQGKVRVIDVGRVNDRYFINNAGTGFDARVAIEALKIPFFRGFLLYFLAIFRTLPSYEIPTITANLDDQVVSMPMTLIVATNGRQYGGGFLITPDAKMDDGLLDICYARGLGRLGILRLLPEVMRGTHVDKEPVTMAKAKRVILDSPDPLPVHADGEIIYTDAHHLEIEIIPRRLRVIT
ncbi:MAG: diacylglycerol/lipid kinase family protein, partial [Anaerolineae bacterium]